MLAKQNKSVDSLPTDMSDNTESEGEPARLPRHLRHHRPSRPGPAARPSRPGPAAHHQPESPDRPDIGAEALTFAAWQESRDPAARDVLTRTVSLGVDDLFTLLFTNSKFFYDFQVRIFSHFLLKSFC
jgi:hypothetical protein